MLIDAALAELDALEPGQQFSYSAIAKKYGVVRSTLTRWHKANTASITTKNINQQRLTPQQEIELVKYIEELTRRYLLPTREMI
jgi:transposase-like protein